MSTDSQRVPFPSASISLQSTEFTSHQVPSTARPDLPSTVITTVPVTITSSVFRNTEAVPSIPFFPYGAIVIVLVAAFVIVLAVFLIVRKSLRVRG